ncbi:MAG: dihydroneopterin aldolase [Paramuribaculum sp.]
MIKTTIEIDRLQFHAHHGVIPQERVVGNDFEVSLRLVYPAQSAVDNDCLDGTLNYATVCAVVREVMAEPSQLLEHVCGRLQQALLERFPLIESGTVKVAKLHPPIPSAQLHQVAVELTWA